MRISDWSSDVCSSDLAGELQFVVNETWIEVISSRYFMALDGLSLPLVAMTLLITPLVIIYSWNHFPAPHNPKAFLILTLVLHTGMLGSFVAQDLILFFVRSEEHTSELQSLMRISYAVFCL